MTMCPPLQRYRRRATARIALLMLVVTTTASAQADSIDVLLLSTPDARQLSIAATGLRCDGVAPRSSRIDASAVGDEVAIGPRRSARCVVTASGELILSSGKRVRRMRGTVRLEARDERLIVVGRMPRATYLVGVLAAEASARDPREYLVALAVLQSNYSRTRGSRHAPFADVCDNTHCQLYHGTGIDASIRSAVAAARQIELSAGGALPCYYSANCGGSSLTPAEVWGRHEAGYNAVRCDDCRNARWHRWSRDVPATADAVRVFASAPAAPFVDDDFKIRAGRVLGFNAVPSNTIDRLERRGARFRISGRGFGHRVGLCQDGARRLAANGRTAAQILSHYFPAATVRRTAASYDDAH